MNVSGFHICNPYCGRCKPSKSPLLICPECGVSNDPDLGEVGHCKVCNARLPEPKSPEPVYCNCIEDMCARPCGQAIMDFPANIRRVCIYHTPLK